MEERLVQGVASAIWWVAIIYGCFKMAAVKEAVTNRFKLSQEFWEFWLVIAILSFIGLAILIGTFSEWAYETHKWNVDTWIAWGIAAFVTADAARWLWKKLSTRGGDTADHGPVLPNR